jgi:predicted dehydrogenase
LRVGDTSEHDRDVGRARVNVALMGSGRAAERHAAALALSPNLSLVTCCENASPGLPAVAERWQVPVGTFDAVLADPTVDAMAICDPGERAVEDARRALAAGKAVVVEPSVLHSRADVDALAAEALTAARPVSVMLDGRLRLPAWCGRHEWSPAATGTVEALRSPLRTRWTTWTANGWTGPKGGASSSRLPLGLVDLMCFLLGRADAVSGEVGDSVDSGGGRHAALAVRFASGAVATIALQSSDHKRRRLRLIDHDRELTITPEQTRWSIHGETGREPVAAAVVLRARVYCDLRRSLLDGCTSGLCSLERARATFELVDLADALLDGERTERMTASADDG